MKIHVSAYVLALGAGLICAAAAALPVFGSPAYAAPQHQATSPAARQAAAIIRPAMTQMSACENAMRVMLEKQSHPIVTKAQRVSLDQQGKKSAGICQSAHRYFAAAASRLHSVRGVPRARRLTSSALNQCSAAANFYAQASNGARQVLDDESGIAELEANREQMRRGEAGVAACRKVFTQLANAAGNSKQAQSQMALNKPAALI